MADTDFQDGPIHDVLVRSLSPYRDDRGWLIEVFRDDELPAEFRPVMMYVSETLPGITRGPHEHVEQADTFAFVGPSRFRLMLWDARESSPTFGHRQAVEAGDGEPMAVTVPAGVVHAYQNIGPVPGWVLNCPNQLYKGEGKKEPVDEIRHEEKEDSPYVAF